MANGKRYFWIKIKDSFMTSDKVDYIMSQPNGASYIVIYQMLCLKCINTNGELSRQIGEVIIPFDSKKIARDLKYFDIDVIEKALHIFKALGMVYQEENGLLRIVDFENMVGSESDWAERKRIQRQNNNTLPENNNGQGMDKQGGQCPLDIRYKRLDKDINLNTHTNNIYISENENSESACASSTVFQTDSVAMMQFSEPQQNYAKQVFELFSSSGLPCSNNNFISFLQYDFKLGIENVRRHGLNSNQVMAAIQNYIQVIKLADKTWWKSKQSFDKFAKENILSFIPERFDLTAYYSNDVVDAAEKQESLKTKNRVRYVRHELSKDPRYIAEVYENHFADWDSSGRPLDEEYFTWQKKFEGETK